LDEESYLFFKGVQNLQRAITITDQLAEVRQVPAPFFSAVLKSLNLAKY
jgi:hypothetical protein